MFPTKRVVVVEVSLDLTNGFQIVAVKALTEHEFLDLYSRLMLHGDFLTISVGFGVHS
jgi:hypothetical protein